MLVELMCPDFNVLLHIILAHSAHLKASTYNSMVSGRRGVHRELPPVELSGILCVTPATQEAQRSDMTNPLLSFHVPLQAGPRAI